MKENHETLKACLEQLGGYQILNSGHFEDGDIDWVKMRYAKDETGYRSLEFLAWLTTDMNRASQALSLFPTAAPPYLNEPGKVLSFVLEVYTGEMGQDAFDENIKFINECIKEYYAACRP